MREIIKDAYKVSELDHQFNDVDRISQENADKHYGDKYLIEEAKHHLYWANDSLATTDSSEPDYKVHAKDKKQLEKFLAKWESKIQPHENDGLSFEKIMEKISL
jgi:cob(I)alamin adenosyltransferase